MATFAQPTVTAIPECWGHRGASASFPENTLMSFIEACKAGADGIETDIHITADDQLIMFHDPELSRTTNGTGKIHDQPWFGVLEHVRTKEEPHQPIPLFSEVLEVLLQPGNEHVKLNIDCKVENDPVRLFNLIKAAIEAQEGWETKLASRCILGIWHPKFIASAVDILPYMPRYAITMSIPQARQYFFSTCQGFSVWYAQLRSAEGAKFRAECAKAGKTLCTWTVNGKEEMKECVRWGIQSVISDKPELWRELKKEILADRQAALQPTLQSYLIAYTTFENWWFERSFQAHKETKYLERESGAFKDFVIPDISLKLVQPSA